MTSELTLTAALGSMGFTPFEYQLRAEKVWGRQTTARPRLCLYYKTGAGKSITSLALMAQKGVTEVLVIAPPSTHQAWAKQATALGITAETISHAKYRQKGYLVPRKRAVIADEVHMFGGHTGMGFKKFDRLAGLLDAPLIVCSATPNYNDADRVYCIQHVIDPHSCKGGFIEFLYKHCETEQNPYGMTPIVTGFRNYPDASQYLDSLERVIYEPDDVDVQIQDLDLTTELPPYFDSHKLDMVRGRIMASQMEERHRRRYYHRVKANGRVHEDVLFALTAMIITTPAPVLMFSMSSKTATVIAAALNQKKIATELITGNTSAKEKNAILDRFRAGEIRVLMGTASLATGTDGLDKVCDRLVIVDDTDDDSLRRQLLGRILPRGADTDASKKEVFRLIIES